MTTTTVKPCVALMATGWGDLVKFWVGNGPALYIGVCDTEEPHGFDGEPVAFKVRDVPAIVETLQGVIAELEAENAYLNDDWYRTVNGIE